MKKFFFFLNFTILFLIFGCVLSINQVLAWTEPVGVPPQNNVPAPVNVGTDVQIKKGALGLMGSDPTTLYGLAVSNGSKAAIKTYNPTRSTTVEINSLEALGGANYYGVSVNASKAFAGIYSYADGSTSYAGKFVNQTLGGTGLYSYAKGQGQGLYAYSANGTGVMAYGGVMGMYVESGNAGMVVKNKDFETDVAYPAYPVAFGPNKMPINYGVVAKIAKSNPAIYPIAVSGQYDASNYGELGQAGIGVYGKGTSYAGKFAGNVDVSGALTIKQCTGAVCKLADIAESLAQREKVSAGDIVATTSDLKLYKATNKDATVVGVVSTNPFLNFNEKENSAPLALSGIVPVNVNVENGAIKAGDFITASSKPGFGMKAVATGTVVGKALENFTGKEGQIKILVNISYFPGLNCQK